MIMLELNCRWMEKLKLFVSGSRVVSAPWNQETVAPFETEGLMKGGAVHGGIPWFNRNVGCEAVVLVVETSGSA